MAARQIRVWTAASLATMCSTLPVFLTGALSVQIRNDLGYSITMVGLFIGSAFAVAGLASASMGRVAQMLGPGRALRAGLAGTALAMMGIAAWADHPWQFLVLIGFSGFVNALNQPAANLLLSNRVRKERLGMALAVKQSGMPGSALLGGAAVPAIALTVGWRWAYVAAAILTLVAIAIQPMGAADTVKLVNAKSNDARPDMPSRLLALYATVGFLGAMTAGAMVSLLTSGATNAGMGEGPAGWLLSLGSAAGITSRLYQGWAVDYRGILPIQRLVWLLGIGSGGLLLMSAASPLSYAVAVVPAFAAGWAWPGSVQPLGHPEQSVSTRRSDRYHPDRHLRWCWFGSGGRQCDRRSGWIRASVDVVRRRARRRCRGRRLSANPNRSGPTTGRPGLIRFTGSETRRLDPSRRRSLAACRSQPALPFRGMVRKRDTEIVVVTARTQYARTGSDSHHAARYGEPSSVPRRELSVLRG